MKRERDPNNMATWVAETMWACADPIHGGHDMEIRTWKCEYANCWRADVLDHEGRGPQGSGDTEMDALRDLAQELWFSHNEALFDVLANIFVRKAEDAAESAKFNGYENHRQFSEQVAGHASGFRSAALFCAGLRE